MTQDMRFYNVSGITESDLDEAEIRIKIAENRDFHKWFALWGPWHKVLERIAPEEWREMMAKRAECIETDEYQSRVNAELEALGIAGDPDAERMAGMRIMEEINQTLFTEIMENILLEKRGELAHERLLVIAERSLSEEGESLFTLRCKQASDKRSVVGKRA